MWSALVFVGDKKNAIQIQAIYHYHLATQKIKKIRRKHSKTLIGARDNCWIKNHVWITQYKHLIANLLIKPRQCWVRLLSAFKTTFILHCTDVVKWQSVRKIQRFTDLGSYWNNTIKKLSCTGFHLSFCHEVRWCELQQCAVIKSRSQKCIGLPPFDLLVGLFALCVKQLHQIKLPVNVHS